MILNDAPRRRRHRVPEVVGAEDGAGPDVYVGAGGLGTDGVNAEGVVATVGAAAAEDASGEEAAAKFGR
jgi:hypothetical protein